MLTPWAFLISVVSEKALSCGCRRDFGSSLLLSTQTLIITGKGASESLLRPRNVPLAFRASGREDSSTAGRLRYTMWFDFYTCYKFIKHCLGLKTLAVALWQDGHEYRPDLKHQPVFGEPPEGCSSRKLIMYQQHNGTKDDIVTVIYQELETWRHG